jgi:hypothetical protein
MQQLAGTRLNAIIVSICFVTAAFRHSGVSSQRRFVTAAFRHSGALTTKPAVRVLSKIANETQAAQGFTAKGLGCRVWL